MTSICRRAVLSLALLLMSQGGRPRAQPSGSVSYDSQYKLGPDSLPRASSPKGQLIDISLNPSKIFPGFSHQMKLYIPADYERGEPLPISVFQDGWAFSDPYGQFRVPTVFDNLIAQRAIPKMAAAFLSPGGFSLAPKGAPQALGPNRSIEYDNLSADYARFLVQEIFPKLEAFVTIDVRPEARAICGHSSGGICAFTAAWQRPDQFRKVYTVSGSFTHIRGGDAYPALIRSSPRKPLRVLQVWGAHDLVVPGEGNWADANAAVAAALDERGYDHKCLVGNGTHNPAFAASIFPDSMRWLWRD